jgi:7-carboxy-7-deazaguanine synthase
MTPPPTTLRVNEVFYSFQGEATHAGTPAIFIRLQGCPVGCSWCDTKHTWPEAPGTPIPFTELIAKDSASPTWANASISDILAYLDRSPGIPLVVITGGEPLAQDIYNLICAIIDTGRQVQVETSGTHNVIVPADTWVTVSPKIDMPGGLPIKWQAIHRADEIKLPVASKADIDAFLALVTKNDIGDDLPVWLQPIDLRPELTDLCVNTAIHHPFGFKVSIQTHQYVGAR